MKKERRKKKRDRRTRFDLAVWNFVALTIAWQAMTQIKLQHKLSQQTVWAIIWCAVLAGRWPAEDLFEDQRLVERGPVPEVLLSRLPLEVGLYPAA